MVACLNLNNHPQSKIAIDDLLIIVTTAIVWIIFVFLNNYYLFWWVAAESWAHLIYFPAGLKLVIVMLFGIRGAFGIFIGAIYTFADAFPFLPLGNRVVTAGFYAAAPLVVCRVFQGFTGKHYPWTDLRFLDIINLSVGSSLLSSLVIFICVIAFSSQPSSVFHVLTLFFGDLIGIFVFFFAIATVRWFIHRFRQ